MDTKDQQGQAPSTKDLQGQAPSTKDLQGQAPSESNDGRRTTASITGAGGAAAWLDDRIAEQRRLGPSFTKDKEAKERARKESSAAVIKREGVAKMTNHPTRSSMSLSSTGAGAADQDDISKSQPLRRDLNQRAESSPLRSYPSNTAAVTSQNNIITKSAVLGENVRQALTELEKDVLLTMPNTSQKITVSHKSQGQHITKSSRTDDAALARMESEVEAKTRATALPPGTAVTKRLSGKEQDAAARGHQFGTDSSVTPTSLNQMEEDVASKARAMRSPSNSMVTRRNRIEEPVASKARPTGSPSVATVESRLSQMEEDVASKARAIESRSNASVARRPNLPMEKDVASSPVPKRLNKLEEDVAAKAHAAGSPSSGTVKKRLSQMEEDVAMKARSFGSPSGATVTKRLNQKQNDVGIKDRATVSPSCAAIKKQLSHMEEDVAVKAFATGNPSAGTITKRVNRKEGELDSKERARAMLNSSKVATHTTTDDEKTTPFGKEGMIEPEHKNLNQTEKDILAKVAARSFEAQTSGENAFKSDDSNPAKAGVPSFGAERTMIARQQIHPGAFATMSTDLEERIAYKTGIPIGTDEKANDAGATEKHTATSSAHNRLSNLTGVSSGALPLTKTEAHHEGSLVSGTQNLTRQGAPLEYRLDLEAFGNDDEGDRLAVAFAVKDDNEDVFIPAAVEYDPDAKPPIYKNRRFRAYSILGCSLLIMIVACMIGVLASQKANDSPLIQVFPTDAPKCARCDLGIEGQLELIVGSAELNDASSPYFQAKEWIIHEDPMELLPDAPNLIQRFLLAVFYFDSHEEGEWLSCNRDVKNDTCSLQKLVGLFPLEYEGVPANRWLSSVHECNWAGIICDELNQTRSIDLHGQGMQGAFPVSLTQLKYVQTLSFSWNNFTGTMPEEIGTMKHLLNLELNYNQFTGSLPGSWMNAKTLQLINVEENFLSGQIPSDVKYLSNLKGMFLSKNMLTGGFPDEFAQLSLLTYARFQSNLLDGEINPIFGKTQLNELWLHGQPLKGTIPSELGSLSNHMFDLRLHNTEIEGTIPEELYNLKDLWRLELRSANLSGTLSTLVGNLQALNVLLLSDNQFTGQLPTELESLPQLKSIWVDANNFSGTVPLGLCDSQDPEGTAEIYADCLADPLTGYVRVECACCSCEIHEA